MLRARHTLSRKSLQRLASLLPQALLACAVVGAETSQPVDFRRDIRPLLSDRCFHCHGPAVQTSGLRLDTFEGATEWAIVPGDAGSSELIARVSLPAGDDSRMPPADSGKPPLTPDEVELLRTWIDSGAIYQSHWAFEAPLRPELPISDSGASNPIDHFLDERRAQRGLDKPEPADRYTLIRRSTLDLTGLPPTPEEVEAFVGDERPDAFERLLDRLLGSPRYGEHMARYWLDSARYADTHGLHLDNYREIWRYRDWVVDAFNHNQAYDRFLLEQLAGDLLENPTDEQLIATGFIRCHVTTNEGGAIEQEVYTRNVFERVDGFGATVLGISVGCAKCHDHKYDPLTQEDYYSLFAFFNSLDGPPMDGNRRDHAPVLAAPTAEQQARIEELRASVSRLSESLDEHAERLADAQHEWEEALRAASCEQDSRPLLASSWRWAGPFPSPVRYQKSDGPQFDPEKHPYNEAQTFESADGAKITWVPRPEWVDGQVHESLPGDAASNFLVRTLTVDEPRKIELSLGSSDGLRVYLNGERVLKSNDDREVEPDQNRLELQLKKGDNVLMVRIASYGGRSGFFFDIVGDAEVLPTEAVDAARVHACCRTADQEIALRRAFLWRHPGESELDDARQEVTRLQVDLSDAQREVSTTLIYRELPEAKSAFVLNRGEYDQPTTEVGRRVPAFLPAMPAEFPRDRLGLAHWAVSAENPLTTRVAVNRFWQQLFGAGLVKTSDDFGSQGEPPSHPRLLDWLAVEFRESDWDVKRLLKLMMTTDAYRAAARATPEGIKADPENRLLSRGPRFRLDAEVLRDQALAVSGLLLDKLGGPPVKPPQPEGLWRAVAYSGSNTAEFVADTEHEKVHRRTLYTFFKRTAPAPQMSVIDAPSREACVVRRERTNTPLQALLLMNDPQYFEAARALAERTLREAPAADAERAAHMLRLCLARPADQIEIEELAASYQDELERLREDEAAARRILSIAPEDPATQMAERAAWTLVANLVLNLDEFVSKN